MKELLAYIPDLHVPGAPTVARLEDGLVAPGTLLRHYSPRARVLLVRGDGAAFCALARAAAELAGARGLRIGLLVTDADLPCCAALAVATVSLGAGDDYPALARTLFARLRSLDAIGVDIILTREIAATGLGRAIRDRLFRAAEGVVVGDGAELKLEIERG